MSADTTKHAPLCCPSCRKSMNASSPLPDSGSDGATPKSGDITLCIHCGVALRYGKDLRLLILATLADFDDLTPDQLRSIRRAQEAIRLLRSS